MTPAPRLPERVRAALPGPVDVAVRAPGRANLMGEHTDHNDGLVLPVALDLATWVAGRRAPGVLRLRSLDLGGDAVEVDLATGEGPQEGWGRYPTAVVRALLDAGIPLAGLDGVLGSDVPPGAGLSSSAALEVALATALLAVPLPAVELARICQHAENDHVGLQSGIMDPLASAAGVAGHALLVDCRTLQVEPVPVPSGLRLLLVDSALPRELAGSAYNDRREECARAAAALGVASLRDADIGLLAARGPGLDPVLLRRARHVVTDDARVLQTAEALRANDLATLGAVFAAGQRSLAEDFEVSVPDLGTLVELAGGIEGVVASRQTGAGFGGCTVSLVLAGHAAPAAAALLSAYRGATGRTGRAWVSGVAGGAGPAGV